MRKQTKVNYETVKALFDEEAGSDCYFKVNGGAEPVTIHLPLSIMHRLYRLAQAYGIKQLRYLEPNVKIIVGSYQMAGFVGDTRKLLLTVNDEVIHHYLGSLLSAIEGPEPLLQKHLAISTGDFPRTS